MSVLAALASQVGNLVEFLGQVGVTVGKNASPAFLAAVEQVVRLHISKGSDYGKPGDTFANMRAAERIGIESWRAAIGKMSDKWSRIETFCTTGNLDNESIEDSLLDISNYALIALTLYREKKASLAAPSESPSESESGHEVSDK